MTFTHFQASELMAMTEKELLYWIDRLEAAHKRYGPRL
jgi:hypothetical protein